MSEKGIFDRWTDRIVNVAVLLIIAFALLRPGGWAREEYRSWRTGVERSRFVQERLDSIARHRSGDNTPVLVEFMDYQCPFCRDIHGSLEDAVDEGRLRIEYRHYPLPIHARAREAALIAICAERLGAFDAVHGWLMETEGWADGPPLVGLSTLHDLVGDSARFTTCVKSPAAAARLDADLELAATLGIRGTPEFVGPGGSLRGVKSIDSLVVIATPPQR